MNYVDLLILGIVGFSIVTALFRGLIKEAISLGVWVAAVWAATVYASQFEYLLANYIGSASIRIIIMYSVLGLGVLLVGSLFNSLIGVFISKSGLGSIDTLLGAVFGGIRGCLIVALILLVIRVVDIPTGGLLASSILAPKFTPLVDWLYQFVPHIGQFSQMINGTNINLTTETALKAVNVAL